MNEEVQSELVLALHWQKLRQHAYYLLEVPNRLKGYIDLGSLDTLCMIFQMLKNENIEDKDQYFGLSDQLLDEVHKSTATRKYKHFWQLISEKTAPIKLIHFENGSREQIFVVLLAKYYCDFLESRLTSHSFSLLVTDGLLAALLASKSITEVDMARIQDSGFKKDIGLLSTLATKPDWVQRLIIGLVQSDALTQLDEMLPGFNNLFAANHRRSLSEIRSDLSSDAASSRHAARNSLGDALDLYICLAGSQDPALSFSPASSLPQATPEKQQKLEPLTAELPGNSHEPMDLSRRDAFNTEANDEDEAAGLGRQQMRTYQRELASAGISGFNSVIVAPTGSGKTLVSIQIAAARLAEDPEGAKVCFLADRKHLVEQQFAAFMDQLPERYKHRIVCLTGGEGERAPLSFCLRENSVLIVSTQILLNSLGDKSDDGLNGDVGKFRLIVFDECHHCDKDHPSKKIMEYYFMHKQSRPGRPLPQIVGLTASPGTGQANRTSDAVEHILRLCASLDCHRLVTVRKSLGSLGSHVNRPSFQMHYTPRKESDSVLECLDLLMDTAETGLLRVYAAQNLVSLPRPPMRNSFLYTNFCGELRAKAFSIGRDGAAVEMTAAWRYLHHCNVAMLLRSLFRSVDALKYLAEHLGDINVLDRTPTCSLDSELRQQFNRLLPQMREFVVRQQTLANRSPALEALRQILTDQFGRDKDSRVLVFVQQRCFTAAVKDYLDSQDAEELTRAGARTGVMTGTNAAGDAGGITQNDQSDLLAAFRRGSVKILISTSVTEEGIDVQKCNAVVRFCHVTNEIAMVQSRGRGRAEGSAYHVIVPEELSWLGQKEQVNRARDEIMLKAVEQLGDMPEDEFQKKVRAVQLELRSEAEEKRERQERLQAANQANAFNLLCSSCGKHLTSSTSLRLAQGCHRLALDPDLLENHLEARRGDTAAKQFTDYAVLGVGLVHKNCGQHIGTLCRYKELAFPEISIQGVVFARAGNSQQRHGPLKKWKLTAKFLAEVEVTSQDLLSWAARVPDIPDHLR